MNGVSGTGSLSPAYSGTFQRTISLLRQDIEASREEATTGRIADPVSVLGARNGERLELSDAAQRIETIIATNRSVSSFLSVAQDATGQVAGMVDRLAQTLVVASGGGIERDFVASEADATLEGLHATLNTRFAGRPVFGGEKTALSPIAPLDDARAEFAASFSSHFGFAPDDPATTTISASAIENFVETVAIPALTGASWSGVISRAGAVSTARIGANESAALGPTVDTAPLKNAFVTALIMAELTGSPLSTEAFEAVVSHGVTAASSAAADAAQLQGATAITEARVEQASERLLAHAGVLTESSEAMVATDPFAAAARFNDLAVKLEAAYTMTGRLQQLTLLRFLP